jgi:hypothetical protein
METFKNFGLSGWISVRIILVIFIFGIGFLRKGCKKCRWHDRRHCRAGRGYLRSDKAMFCGFYEER